MLSIKTVGSKESENHISDPKPFQELHDLLEAQFPLLWKSLKVEKVRYIKCSRVHLKLLFADLRHRWPQMATVPQHRWKDANPGVRE